MIIYHFALSNLIRRFISGTCMPTNSFHFSPDFRQTKFQFDCFTMSKRSMLLAVFFAISFYKCYQLFTYYPEIPEIIEEWWTQEDPAGEDVNIYSFKINVSQKILDDLNYRLKNTRPFHKPLLDNQMYGFNGDLAHDILQYWSTKYDWKEREQRMNQYPHFITSIQGLKIHFMHIKPQNTTSKKVLPLFITHGWPSSFVEILDVIPILTTPQENYSFVFELVYATIPGFGFSQAPEKPGFGVVEAAVVFKNLMARLNHHQFYASGGDLGFLIIKMMCAMYPDSILGVQTNMCLSVHPFSLLKYILGSIYPSWIKRNEHRDLYYPIGKLLGTLWLEFGYLHSQSTKPDTYGVAVDDSPMGMAVLYLEKFSTGGSLFNRLKKDGGLNGTYNLDDLLDNVMTYWVTQSGTSSFRFYAEIFHGYKAIEALLTPVKAPTSCANGPYDIIAPDGIVQETFPNIVHTDDYNYGHFVNYENPYVVANNIYESISRMERIQEKDCGR